MVLSRGLSYLVGVLTVWPVVYLVAFVGFILVLVGTGGPVGGDEPPTAILVVFALHLFTILLMTGLLVFYLVAVLRDERLKQQTDRRTLWIVLNVVVGPVAWPAYWWTFLRPGSEEFRVRTQG